MSAQARELPTHLAAPGHPVVLLVDDEPHVVASLRDSLRGRPIEVVTATSSLAALEIVRQREVDAVVSDEQMPGMRGAEFLAAVRRLQPGSVRIMLTGHATLDVAIAAINEGQIYRLLIKPCHAADVYQAIQQGLQLRLLAHGTTRLLAKARRQEAMLRQLEAQNPGISEVETDESGAIVLQDPSDVAALIAELERRR